MSLYLCLFERRGEQLVWRCMERLQALHQALYPAVCIASPNGDFPFEPSPDHKVGTERMKLCARENPVNVLIRTLQVAGPQKYENRPIQKIGRATCRERVCQTV